MNILFNYQVPVYTRRILELEEHSESNMLMATGTGKTVVSAHIATYYLEKGYRGLFLYNENEGLRQAEKSYRKIIGEEISFSTFYGQQTKDWNADQAQMLFASFQSMNSIHGKWYEIFSKDHFHFIIIDESHHDQAPTYKEVIDYFVAKKLRMTATPSDDNAWSETEETITLPQAIANGWLSQVEYSLLSDGINNRKLKQIMQDVLEKGQRISVKQLNENIFIKKRTNTEAAIIKRRAGTKQTMIFCENIAHGKHVAKSFKQGTVGLVHSQQSETMNHNILESFRNKNIQFIISVDKFNEAIDIPDAEVVVFLRATNSKRIFFQQLGRGLRKTKFKNKVIVLDFVGNIERLVMVAELGKEIREEAQKLGHNLSKDIFDIKGEHYDLNFTETVFRDILKVIDAINSGFLSYEELKKEVQAEGVNTTLNYKEVQKSRLHWPSSPWNKYVDQYSHKDFFGVKFLSYPDLRKAIQKEKIDSWLKYNKAQKTRSDWPSNPNQYYKNEWISWLYFIHGRKDKYLTFYDLKKEVLVEKIDTSTKYLYLQRKRKNWPRHPEIVYYEWVSWHDFFGRERNFLSYPHLREAIQKEKIDSWLKYNKAQKTRSDWPSRPQDLYKDQYSFEDFFGGRFLSYEDLRKEVQSTGIDSTSNYREAQKTRANWPNSPWTMYKDQYSYEDFFGVEKIEFLLYPDLRKAIQKEKIDSRSKYLKSQKTRPSWPSSPWVIYADEYSSEDFFGVKKFLSYSDLKKEVQTLGIISWSQYNKARKSQSNWPASPWKMYADEYSYNDFFGKE